MIESYRPSHFPDVASFARHQSEFDYLLGIIRAHIEQRAPGGVWVWREAGRVAAICGMAFLNRDDAWLYGMRVSPRFKGKGIATRLTRGLFEVAAKNGRSWVGLDALNHSRKAPVFRIAEKLGMSLEATYTTSLFWALPGRFRSIELARARDVFDHRQGLGEKLMFHELYPRWVWSRLLPARRSEVNRGGRLISGMPVHVVSSDAPRGGAAAQRAVSGKQVRTIVNWFTRPLDLAPALSTLLSFARGRNRFLVINHPADWAPELRSTARELAPGLRLKKNCDFATWRVYGFHLRSI